MVDLLKELCLIDGISGREDRVRNYIISEIKDKCEYKIDPMGNIIAFKKGRNRALKKVMISAHMDEVGYIVTYICDNGFLKFTSVGGVDSKVTLGKTVTVGEKGIRGVIGNKTIHLCHGDEETSSPKLKQLYIDIGAKNKEDAERYVEIGDSVHFVSDFVTFGNKKIKAKAIDDRFGCAVMLKMLDSELDFDTYFAFLVQEEVGCRGASAAAFTVKPDYAIVLESTTAADVAFVDDSDRVCVQEGGAVVSFMDRSTLYNRDIFKGAFKLAKNNNIKIQTKTTVAGGNDAGAIHKSNGGIYTVAISLPCRYIHSATSVADTSDMKSCYDLAVLLAENYAQNKIS